MDARPEEVEHWKRAERELFAETNDGGTKEIGGNGQEPKQQTGLNGVNRTSEERLPSRSLASASGSNCPATSTKPYGWCGGPSYHPALILRFCNAVGGIRSLFECLAVENSDVTAIALRETLLL